MKRFLSICTVRAIFLIYYQLNSIFLVASETTSVIDDFEHMVINNDEYHSTRSPSNRANSSTESNLICNTDASECRDGLILPVWLPLNDIGIGTTIARALIYGVSLCYLFLGASIISDRFMSAIEVITSQEREIHVTDSNGNKQTVKVRYWNETVSNLTVSLKYFNF